MWTELVWPLRPRGGCSSSARNRCAKKWRTSLRSKFNVTAHICQRTDFQANFSKDDLSGRRGLCGSSLPCLPSAAGAAGTPCAWPKRVPAFASRRLPRDARRSAFRASSWFDEAHHLRKHRHYESNRSLSSCARLRPQAVPVGDPDQFCVPTTCASLLKLIDPDTCRTRMAFRVLHERERTLCRRVEASRRLESFRYADLKKTFIEAIARWCEILRTGKRSERLREELSRGMQDTPQNECASPRGLEEMSLLGSIFNRTRATRCRRLQGRSPAGNRAWPMSDIEREFYGHASRRNSQITRISNKHQRTLPACADPAPPRVSLPAALRTGDAARETLSLDDER